MNNYFPGKGNDNPSIVFILDIPLVEDLRMMEHFSGPTGLFFKRLMAEAGININNCWFTSVCKHNITTGTKLDKASLEARAKHYGINIQEQIEHLQSELFNLKPNIIVPLGKYALWALSGLTDIGKRRGSICSFWGYKAIPTYNPQHIIQQNGDVKGYWNKQILFFDLKRIAKESLTSQVSLPVRHLQVAKTPSDIELFFHKNHDKHNPAIDIEAHQCIPICVGISYEPHNGLTIPLWNHNHISDMPDAAMVRCWDLLSNMLAQERVVGQNFGYDRDKLKRLGFDIKGLHSDTMLKAFVINPELPKNLAFNTSIYTREPYYKDEGMYEGSVNDLLIGCARDACVTKEIDLAMDSDLDELGCRSYYEQFILPLHDLYLAIENQGFAVDESIRKELLTKYITWSEENQVKISTIAGKPININSPKQVSDLLYKEWHLPPYDGTGEDQLTLLLNNKKLKNKDHKQAIELILETRRVEKTISSYLLSPTDYDGRMRTSYFICLETGRSSTSQQEPPIRPYVIDKRGKKTTKRAMGMAFQTITKHGDIGSDVRKMLVADPGHVFLQVDSSQAEARVIFLLAEDYEALEAIDKHDYHALTASWFFGGTENDYSKKVLGYESPIRFVGKTLRHAGHLGASARRAMMTVNTDARKNKIDIEITEAKARESLMIFHRKQPKIKGIFQQGVIDCLSNNRILRAPVPYGIDASVGGTRIFYERWGDELFRKAFSYIPQRTVSENTKAAGLRINRNYRKLMPIVLESHDALVTMVLEREADEAAIILKNEFEKPINFETCSLKRGSLVIPSEVEIGYNYKEFKRWKF